MLDILFITSSEKLRFREESNGTLLLATKLLHNNYTVDILRFAQIDHYKEDYNAFINSSVEQILSRSPKCVSFYTLWAYYHIMMRIAHEIKNRNHDIIIVFGGPQATLTAEETITAADYIDYVCTGEGENTILPFANCIINNNNKHLLQTIPGLFYRKNGKVMHNDATQKLTDLENLERWDESLFIKLSAEEINSMQKSNYYMPIDAGRGCPFNCTFCCTSKLFHRSYRLKSATRIIEDIKYHMEKFNIRSFYFAHDAFTTNNKLVEQVCDLIIAEKIKINWRCTSRIDLITKDLILKMKAAGMSIIELGIESGSMRMQKIINKRLDLNKAKEMIEFLRANKIKICLFFMYGFPEETEEDLNETLEFYYSMVDIGLTTPSMAYCRFYPSAELTNKYYHELSLDPKFKKVTRGIFGYKEEYELIASNKKIFTFFYDTDIGIRGKYQYMYYLAHMYEDFPNSIHHLRKTYKGDNLRFYDDFYNANINVFNKDIASITEECRNNALQMLNAHVDSLYHPSKEILKALLQFDNDINAVKKSTKDITIQKSYCFSYVDIQLKSPLESYMTGKTEILMKNKDGKFSMQVLKISG